MEEIIAERQKNLELKHELELSAKLGESVSAAQSALTVRNQAKEQGPSNVDGATLATAPMAWKTAKPQPIAWGKQSSATAARPAQADKISWDSIAPEKNAQKTADIDFPTPASLQSRSLSWPGHQDHLKKPMTATATGASKYQAAIEHVERAREHMERRVSQEESALQKEAREDERRARDAGHVAAAQNVERVRHQIWQQVEKPEAHKRALHQPYSHTRTPRQAQKRPTDTCAALAVGSLPARSSIWMRRRARRRRRSGSSSKPCSGIRPRYLYKGGLVCVHSRS